MTRRIVWNENQNKILLILE